MVAKITEKGEKIRKYFLIYFFGKSFDMLKHLVSHRTTLLSKATHIVYQVQKLCSWFMVPCSWFVVDSHSLLCYVNLKWLQIFNKPAHWESLEELSGTSHVLECASECGLML